jgi:hypothetical protein
MDSNNLQQVQDHSPSHQAVVLVQVLYTVLLLPGHINTSVILEDIINYKELILMPPPV